MFGLSKKDGLTGALHSIQAHYRKTDLWLELSPRQIKTIERLRLFRDIDDKYKSRGLTKWGALAWFCSQVIGTTMKNINDGKAQSRFAFDLAEKLALVALFIRNSIPEMKLTKEDMESIEVASQYALEWGNYTSAEDANLFSYSVLPWRAAIR